MILAAKAAASIDHNLKEKKKGEQSNDTGQRLSDTPRTHTQAITINKETWEMLKLNRV